MSITSCVHVNMCNVRILRATFTHEVPRKLVWRHVVVWSGLGEINNIPLTFHTSCAAHKAATPTPEPPRHNVPLSTFSHGPSRWKFLVDEWAMMWWTFAEGFTVKKLALSTVRDSSGAICILHATPGENTSWKGMQSGPRLLVEHGGLSGSLVVDRWTSGCTQQSAAPSTWLHPAISYPSLLPAAAPSNRQEALQVIVGDGLTPAPSSPAVKLRHPACCRSHRTTGR